MDKCKRKKSAWISGHGEARGILPLEPFRLLMAMTNNSCMRQITSQLYEGVWRQWVADTQTLAERLPKAFARDGPPPPQDLITFERWLMLLKVGGLAACRPACHRPPVAGSECSGEHTCSADQIGGWREYRVEHCAMTGAAADAGVWL